MFHYLNYSQCCKIEAVTLYNRAPSLPVETRKYIFILCVGMCIEFVYMYITFRGIGYILIPCALCTLCVDKLSRYEQN